MWFLDPLARMLEVLRLEGTRYVLIDAWREDAVVRAEPFEARALELAARWGDCDFLLGPGLTTDSPQRAGRGRRDARDRLAAERLQERDEVRDVVVAQREWRLEDAVVQGVERDRRAREVLEDVAQARAAPVVEVGRGVVRLPEVSASGRRRDRPPCPVTS